MPVVLGKDSEGCFARWGKSGAKYHYECGNRDDMKEAKKKAIAQGVASGDLEALGAHIQVIKGTYKFASDKIGMDFDGTLSTKEGQRIWRLLGGDYVITARSPLDLEDVWKVTDRLGISRDRVIGTGSNRNKIDKVKSLGITTFYDNNNQVVVALPGVGKLFRS